MPARRAVASRRGKPARPAVEIHHGGDAVVVPPFEQIELPERPGAAGTPRRARPAGARLRRSPSARTHRPRRRLDATARFGNAIPLDRREAGAARAGSEDAEEAARGRKLIVATNIGLNVIEVDGSAARAIQGAAVSVGAFNILTRRGVPNRPARVTSFADFIERFGGYDSGSHGAYLVKGFFDNGGQRAYVNRVVGTGANAPAASNATIASRRRQLGRAAALRGRLPRAGRPRALGRRASRRRSRPRSRRACASGRRRSRGTARRSRAWPASPSATPCSSARAATARSSTITALNPGDRRVSWAPDIANSGDFDAAATTVGFHRLRPRASRPARRAAAGRDLAAAHPRAAARRATRSRSLNDPLRGSKLVRAADPRAAADQTTADTPGRRASSPRWAAAADGAVSADDFIGDEAAHTGFRAFDPLDIQLARHRAAPTRRRPRRRSTTARTAATACSSARCRRRRSAGGTAIEYGAQLPGQEGLRRALRAVDRRLRPARRRPDADPAHPARRPRDGRLRADRDERAASTRRPPATRRGCSARSTSSTGSATPSTPTWSKTGSVNGIRAIPGAGHRRRRVAHALAPTSAGATSTSACSSTT